MHFDYQSESKDSIVTSILACEQALHVGDIVKRRRARGTWEETRTSPFAQVLHNKPTTNATTYGIALTKHVQRTWIWRELSVYESPHPNPSVNTHLDLKGQMNQKFDIFYFSSVLVKYV